MEKIKIRKGKNIIITVVDSIMGSGKTTWAINYMNAHPEDHFLYITPYLPEQERIMRACPDLEFKQPEEKPTKSAHFHALLKDGCNIALTHSLFSILILSEKEKELLKLNNYILMLDEVIEVVEKINVKPDDIEMLVKTGKIEIKIEEERRVYWKDKEYDGQFEVLKREVENGCVVQSKHGTLLRLFPEDMIKILRDAYVLTYMFEGSYLKPYFEIFKMEYKMAFIEEGMLIYGLRDDSKRKAEIKELMDIEQNHSRNLIGYEDHTLTKNWYDKETKKRTKPIPLNNAYNYLHHSCGANQQDAMYTVYDDVIHGKGFKHDVRRYGDAAFVPCNSRATNIHGGRKYLAYLINLHTDPTIDEWFKEHGKVINGDAIVFSSMLQWIWRSAIRNGEKIKLYIPSWRMRKMLEGWLDGMPAGQIACPDLEERSRKIHFIKPRSVKRESSTQKKKSKKKTAK